MRSKRYLGPLDAAADRDLQTHFVSQDDLAELLEPQSHIIYGAKGAGKTAMRRAISEIHRDSFFATGTVDLDTLSFEKVHRELDRLHDTTGEEITSLARTIWRNVLLGYCLEFVKEKVTDDAPMDKQIQDVLQAEQFVDRKAPDRVHNQIVRLFNALGKWGTPDSLDVTKRPLTEEQRLALDGFSSTQPLADLLQRCVRKVTDSNSPTKPVAVCIDGFDSIIDHDPKSRGAIFVGLVDAVYRFCRDQEFSNAFCFKVFLPRELTQEARDKEWDADKFLDATCLLHWSEDSLKDFLVKRLVQHSKSYKRSEPTFEAVWHEFMPTTVRNSVYDIDEPSFPYILRHTQFRPRQLLFQVQSLLDDWDKKSNDFRIAASFIPKTVSKSSRKQSENTVAQLEYALPGLGNFLRSWGGGLNMVPFGDCFSKIKRVFNLDDNVKARQVFDELFEFGVLGVAREEGSPRNRSIQVRFSYVGDGVLHKMQPEEENLIALCPMFADYFDCKPSPFAVIPV